MLPRGRPRALGAAALLLLLLLLLIGFFLFGGDLACERREQRGPGSFPCALTPRVPPDGDPSVDHPGHSRSDCVPLRPLPHKCEVGARGLWWRESRGRRAPSPASWTPVGITTSGVVAPALTSKLEVPWVRTSPAPVLCFPI